MYTAIMNMVDDIQDDYDEMLLPNRDDCEDNTIEVECLDDMNDGHQRYVLQVRNLVWRIINNEFENDFSNRDDFESELLVNETSIYYTYTSTSDQDRGTYVLKLKYEDGLEFEEMRYLYSTSESYKGYYQVDIRTIYDFTESKLSFSEGYMDGGVSGNGMVNLSYNYSKDMTFRYSKNDLQTNEQIYLYSSEYSGISDHAYDYYDPDENIMYSKRVMSEGDYSYDRMVFYDKFVPVVGYFKGDTVQRKVSIYASPLWDEYYKNLNAAYLNGELSTIITGFEFDGMIVQHSDMIASKEVDKDDLTSFLESINHTPLYDYEDMFEGFIDEPYKVLDDAGIEYFLDEWNSIRDFVNQHIHYFDLSVKKVR